jgi:hypothetical protein
LLALIFHPFRLEVDLRIVILYEPLHDASLHLQILEQQEQSENTEDDHLFKSGVVNEVVVSLVGLLDLLALGRLDTQIGKNEDGHNHAAPQVRVHGHVGFVTQTPWLGQDVRDARDKTLEPASDESISQ